MTQSYSYGADTGYIYAVSNLDRTVKMPRVVSIYLTACRSPFEVTLDGHSGMSNAIMLKPMVARRVRVKDAALVAAIINPSHPSFRRFSIAPGPAAYELDREIFAPLEPRLIDLHRGQLSVDASIQLLQDIIATAADQFAPPPPLDLRVAHAIDSICSQPTIGLMDLANAVDLSYHRLSHLFSQQMGLSLRTFQLWRKLDTAWRLIDKGHDLATVSAQSGFVDAAHFCKVFFEAHGRPLSQLKKKTSLNIKYANERLQFGG